MSDIAETPAATTHGIWAQAYTKPTTSQPAQQPAPEATRPAEATPEATQNDLEATETGYPAHIHPVMAETLDTFKAEGIVITPSDPEYQAIEDEYNNPDGSIHQYRKTVYKQIEAKKARQAKPAPTTTHGIWGQAYTKPATTQTPAPTAKPAKTTNEIWSQAYTKGGK
jgi:hypothetical protein